MENVNPFSNLLLEQNAFQDSWHEQDLAARDQTINAFAQHPGRRFQRWAARLAGCCSVARFYVDPDAGEVHPWLNRCRHKLCPTCARVRSAHVADQLHVLLTVMAHPTIAVLTVKSNDLPLEEQLADLRKYFRTLRGTALWKENILGGAYTIEATRNHETHQWHPHLHIIHDGKYLPQKLLKAAWNSITGGSRIVHIQAVKDRRGAASELAKYLGKPQKIADLSDTELREFALAVNGTRMVQTFGDCYGKTVQDKDPGSPNSPNTYSVSLARLVYLAKQGAETPLRLVDLIAQRYPRFGRYIYHEMPQLDPDPTSAQRTARLCNMLNHPSPARQNRSPPADELKLLDEKIFSLFSRYHQEGEQGLYLHYDLPDWPAVTSRSHQAAA